MTAAGARVLVFDSGMGGLSVVRALRRRMPDAQLTYAADTAAFPYGAWDEPALVERICHVIGQLISHTAPQVVVIACNTASTLALEQLRFRFSEGFVGTVPAIKPAAVETRSGVIGVLATVGTVSREYTRSLIDTYAYHCDVILHGCTGLAAIAERKMQGQDVDLGAVRAEIAPVFVDRQGKRTDVVVLGCTHYPLLLDELVEAAPWDCRFIDPSDAIARRTEVLAAQGVPTAASFIGPVAFVTSKSGLAGAATFAGFGFEETRLIDLPASHGV